MKPDTRNRLMYVGVDWLMTSTGWLLFNVVRYHTLEPQFGMGSLSSYLAFPDVWRGQVLFPLMLLLIYWVSGFYNKTFSKSRIDSLAETFVSTLIGSVVIYFIAIFNDPIPDRMSNFMLIGMLEGLLFLMVGMGRLIISTILLRLRCKRIIWRNAMVIGTPETIDDCIRIFNKEHPAIGLKVVAQRPVTDYLGDVPPDVDMFIVAIPDMSTHEIMGVVRHLYKYNRPIYRADWYDHGWPIRSRVTNVAGFPLTDISSVVVSESTRNIKRMSDVVISVIALILLFPFLLAVAVAVKAGDRGPVIFSQERVGRRGKKFNIYKFRTMVPDAEPEGPRLSAADDSRITSAGRFLRKYRIDELPQFWNVIKGDMSLVGPRPEREYYEEQIIERAPQYTLLHQLRPGITSWGMVKYGYASDIDAMLRRMHYDIIYLENVSIIIDIKILFYTVNTVITGKGV